MSVDNGRLPDGTGLSSLRDEAGKPSSPKASIPSAWPLMGYAPGNYMGRCHDCGAERIDLDKRAWQCLECAARAANAALASFAQTQNLPVPIVLHCPECRARHIDEGEFATKAHHTHSCQSCGLTWRPAVVATVGVQFLPGFKNDPAIAIETEGQDRETGLGAEHESAGRRHRPEAGQ
jgi:hypothetical protein